MNPEFEKIACDQMLNEVKRRQHKKRIVRVCSIVFLMLFTLQSLYLLVSDSSELNGLADVTTEEKVPAMPQDRPYTAIITKSTFYEEIETGSPAHVVVYSDYTRNYIVLGEGELMAALPDDAVLRIEDDGSATVLNAQ